MKPNCYDCKYRGSIPGDCHSECNHPSINASDRVLTPVLMLNGMVSPAQKRLNVYGQGHGIKMGWFMWPLNFDPVWLMSCNGFESKEKEQNENEKQRSE